MSDLSPQSIAELIALADEARNKRTAYSKALQQHNANKVSLNILKGQVLASKRSYVNAYTKAGLNRQGAWQLDKTSRGLCRLCGKPVLPGRKHCVTHEEWITSPERKKRDQ